MPAAPRIALVLLALCLAGPALSHDGLEGPAFIHERVVSYSGFASGFLHPVLGWDHVVAMVAVGLLGAFLGGTAIWMLPVVFPLVMACGATLGVVGRPMAFVETGIAVSAIVLGALIADAVPLPHWLAGLVVGVFAIFHGYAHGAELPGSVDAFAYAVGFVLATGLLHLAGIAPGRLVRWPAGKTIVRTGGAAISALGVVFLLS